MADLSNDTQLPSGETLMSAPDAMVKVRDVGVVPIGREGVLDEGVRPDTEEIAAPRQVVRRERGAGCLDHDAERGCAVMGHSFCG